MDSTRGLEFVKQRVSRTGQSATEQVESGTNLDGPESKHSTFCLIMKAKAASPLEELQVVTVVAEIKPVHRSSPGPLSIRPHT